MTIESLPERTIIIAATAEQIATVAQLPFVQYVGPYLAAYKFSPFAAAEQDEFLIQIANIAASQASIGRIRDRVGGFLSESPYGNQLTAHIRTERVIAQQLLDEPFVLGVERHLSPGLSDERQALSLTEASTPAGGNYLQWLAQWGITPNQLTSYVNSGPIVVDVADTGLDLGCVSNSSQHPDLIGRKAYLKGPVAPGTDTGRHGTVVAGIIAGNPVQGIDTTGAPTTGTGLKDSDSHGSFHYGLGVAPGVRIGSTRIFGGTSGTVAQWTTAAVTSRCSTPAAVCMDTSTLCRAVVQNHSHNEYDATGTNAGVYTSRAREFDISVRDADRSTRTPLAITMSAGNYNQNPDDVTTWVMASATAKNVISVGAAESVRDGIPVPCQDPALAANSNPLARHSAAGYDVLAYASRRGTKDGRLKPDLIAPGTLIYGPRPQQATGATYCAATDSSALGYSLYHGASGTPWSAPVAAGAIALLRYKYGWLSPAMYKAMLVGGTRSLSGKPDRMTGGFVAAWPNEQQGFGMINLADLLGTSPTKAWHDQGTTLTQGQIYERTVTVADPSKPVRIVLVWTDVPGAVCVDPGCTANAQVNDLDLMAYGPTKTRAYGNATQADGFSRWISCSLLCTPPVDQKNNVEVIHINPIRFSEIGTTVTVRVTASSLNGVALAGQSGGANNQDFALFVMNGTLN